MEGKNENIESNSLIPPLHEHPSPTPQPQHTRRKATNRPAKLDKVPDEKRKYLIQQRMDKKRSLKELHEELGIKYATCKTIMRLYRSTGRTEIKKTRDRKCKSGERKQIKGEIQVGEEDRCKICKLPPHPPLDSLIPGSKWWNGNKGESEHWAPQFDFQVYSRAIQNIISQPNDEENKPLSAGIWWNGVYYQQPSPLPVAASTLNTITVPSYISKDLTLPSPYQHF